MGQDSLLYRYVVSSLQPVPIRQRCYEKQPQLRQTYCEIPEGCRRFGRSGCVSRWKLIEPCDCGFQAFPAGYHLEDGRQKKLLFLSFWLRQTSLKTVFPLLVGVSHLFSNSPEFASHQFACRQSEYCSLCPDHTCQNTFASAFTSEMASGDPLDELTSSSPCLPPLQPSRTHKCDSNPVKPPIPYPDDYQDKWNGLFVRMPCSPESVYPVYEEAILSYNYRFKSYWNFKTLEQLCMMNLIPDGGNDNFFGNTLSGICSLALNLPIFVTKVISCFSMVYNLLLKIKMSLLVFFMKRKY
ncbi:unnamed protein product [Schistosoma curassoni]|uniref:FZ domain-containing protein n=1 Tax=Schistosoma curassoni TaxID=6186 RepID=A0A183KXX7_9TREM|nr:unnamed protein product [Schistosoma curassoni]